MRGARAGAIASQVASTSAGIARESAHTTARFTVSATARTDARSPGDEVGKPASITSTPIASSRPAISTFAAREKNTPAACSPSRSVVSKTTTRSRTDIPTVRFRDRHDDLQWDLGRERGRSEVVVRAPRVGARATKNPSGLRGGRGPSSC